MRTTITLADDVSAAVTEMRRSRDVGLSVLVNELIRHGLVATGEKRPPFVQDTSSLGRPLVPLDNVSEALAALEGDAHT